MIKFKNDLASRIFNLAIQVEKMSNDTRKIRKMEDLEMLAELQTVTEKEVNSLFIKTKKVQKALKNKQKGVRDE